MCGGNTYFEQLFVCGVVRDTVLIVSAIVIMTLIFIISFVVYVYR